MSESSASDAPTDVSHATPPADDRSPAEVELGAVSAEADHLTVGRPSEGVVLVTLHQPERRNAMSGEMTAAWRRVMRGLADDPSVRCVVVTGAGSAFCSGGDIGWIGAEPQASVADLRARMIDFYRTWLSVRDLEVPTIAAINGPAVGAGAAVALACTIRYAGQAARLSVPFTRLGLHPGMATTYLLPEVAGLAAARDLLLTGRTVAADEMLTLGLVSRVLPDAELLNAARESAAAIAAAAPIATRLTTVALADGGHRRFDEALQWEALAQSVTLATHDLQEGLAAVRERREPRFTGR